jgi:hypothetical protein
MTRQAYLAERFNEWLDRYAPPRFIAENPQAMQDEADVLLRIVARHAPAEGYAEWLDDVTRHLTEGMTARTWPTGGEVTKACAKASTHGARRAEPAANWAPDPHAITARRIAAGEPVGDDWIYGRRCVELLRSGLVTVAQVKAYRSSLFFAMRDLYGEAEAMRREGDYKAKHAAAVEVADAKPSPRDVSVSPRRMPASRAWEAAE